MLPCTFLHSLTGMDVLQVEKLQQTRKVIMLSLPQTLPARMYVPYLAGEVHMSAISLSSCLITVKLCLSAICALMAAMQYSLSPDASEQHVLFRCLLLSSVHPTMHLETRHGNTVSELLVHSTLDTVSWPHPSWGTQGGLTDVVAMALQGSQKPISCRRPASAPAAAACSPLQDAALVQSQVFAGRQPSMQWQPPHAQQLLACKPPSS